MTAGMTTAKSSSACHRCPHNLTDSSGSILPKYRKRKYESLPCSTCTLNHSDSVINDNDRFNDWRTPISLDALTTDGCIGDAEKTLWGEEREDWTQNERLADFLRIMLRMDSTTQRIVSRWLLGESLVEIAGRTGITVQAVHKRIKQAQKQIPQLKKAGDVTR